MISFNLASQNLVSLNWVRSNWLHSTKFSPQLVTVPEHVYLWLAETSVCKSTPRTISELKEKLVKYLRESYTEFS